MTIELRAIGGYGEVGRNMTAVKVDDDVVLLDMGLHMPNFIKYTQGEEDKSNFKAHALMSASAVPDLKILGDWRDKVRAVIISHAHLDHVGAVPYLAGELHCPIVGSPYTMAVLKAILADNNTKLRNNIISVPLNGTYTINKNLKIELINVTHSIPHQCMLAVHTSYGVVLYATDFKFDNNPVVGERPNYAAMKRISNKVVVAMIDALYAHDERKTPSESVVKEMLRDVMMGTYSKGNAVIITTFASHIARLKTITDFGKQLGRKVVFCGRSLDRYVSAAESIGLASFRDVAMRGRYGHETKGILKKIQKEGSEKFLLVVTGHQGEPGSVLTKMASGKLPFKFSHGDHVIFSSLVIPQPQNVQDRQKLESELKARGVRVFKDIHVSGHPCREDLYELLRLVKPKQVIPVHAEHDRMDAFIDFAESQGYVATKTAHELFTGQAFSVFGRH